MRCRNFGITVFCIASLSLGLIGCQSLGLIGCQSGTVQTDIVPMTPDKLEELKDKVRKRYGELKVLDRNINGQQAKLSELQQQAASNQNELSKEALEAEKTKLTEEIKHLKAQRLFVQGEITAMLNQIHTHIPLTPDSKTYR